MLHHISPSVKHKPDTQDTELIVPIEMQATESGDVSKDIELIRAVRIDKIVQHSECTVCGQQMMRRNI
jgi:hypothetical protein